MHKKCLTICWLTILVMVGCRPTNQVWPNTPAPATNSVSPLPTPVVPQVVLENELTG